METIEQKTHEYKEALYATDQARLDWQRNVKPLIEDTLLEVVLSTNLDWFTQTNDSLKNQETVLLAFKQCPSRIHYNEDDFFNIQEGKSGFLMKEGGTLNFSQFSNQAILVWITYPFIEGIMPKPATKDLRVIKQIELTAEFIKEMTVRFLDEMIAWENEGSERSLKIGYRYEA